MEKESARSHALFTSVKMISSFRLYCKPNAWCPPTHPYISFIRHLYGIQPCNFTSHQLVFSGCTACGSFVLFVRSCYHIQVIEWHYDNDAIKKGKKKMWDAGIFIYIFFFVTGFYWKNFFWSFLIQIIHLILDSCFLETAWTWEIFSSRKAVNLHGGYFVIKDYCLQRF